MSEYILFKKRYFWIASTIIYCIAIFITTASSASTGGNTLHFLATIFPLTENQAQLVNLVFRKSVHLGAYGVLAILLYKSFATNRYVNAWLFATLYAASDELHQAFLPDRTGSVIDVGLDSLGAILALLLVRIIVSFKSNRNFVK